MYITCIRQKNKLLLTMPQVATLNLKAPMR